MCKPCELRICPACACLGQEASFHFVFPVRFIWRWFVRVSSVLLLCFLRALFCVVVLRFRSSTSKLRHDPALVIPSTSHEQISSNGRGNHRFCFVLTGGHQAAMQNVRKATMPMVCHQQLTGRGIASGGFPAANRQQCKMYERPPSPWSANTRLPGGA